MIGRLLRGGFMTAIYAYLYIPIIILIVNSFNSSRFGITGRVLPPTGIAC
ncbi:spermidine/putrescine ABC transporter membrane protein [Klebsiella michiganensis]|uniref:Spermidine/putrescine ABC transporter membrane protein n=1 Tax=Klebsiella michiganensis TaxID=1134687 RepID=A0A7H4LUZ3_9ENTR|nr:spermidine/putrescine ABC transporter membrane protein [Klebsiella michiganensis]